MRHTVTVGSRNAGFSMMEVMIAMMILAVAIAGLLATIIPASRLIMVNRETTIAMAAAMAMVEYMSDPALFPELFVLYNSNPDFDVPGLEPRGDNPTVGKIHFPTYAGQLREDILDQEYMDVGMDVHLGMPRDLGAPAGVIDAADHAGDYYILPVVIRLEWSGIAGSRSLMMSSLIAER